MSDRTLSMMVYEDWRPKLNPEIIQWMKCLANAYPSNLAAMGQQAQPNYCQGLISGLIGGEIGAGIPKP